MMMHQRTMHEISYLQEEKNEEVLRGLLFFTLFLCFTQALKKVKKRSTLIFTLFSIIMGCCYYLKFLLLFLFFLKFFQNIYGDEDGQNFTIQAYDTNIYLIPMFSESSNFTDFQKSLNFFLALPNIPSVFNIFVFQNDQHKIVSCFKRTFLCEYNFDSYLNSTDFQEIIYNSSSITLNPLEMSETAVTLILQDTPLCDYTINTCFINRINLVFLTDYNIFEKIYQIKRQIISQIYYFVISSRKYEVTVPFQGQEYEIKYYYCDKDLPNKEISDVIFDDIILYTLNAYRNFYNIFLVVDEASLNVTLDIAEDLLSSLPNSFSWGFLSPRLYTLAIKRNETFYYQTSTLYLNGMFREHFLQTVTTHFNSTSTFPQTTLLENNLKQIFLSDLTGFYDIQWNILISDEFPHWIKNTDLIFDSFIKHLDVYLFYPANIGDNNYLLQEEISENMNEIILDDGNATIRGNHLMLINLEVNSTKQLPTFKTSMDATIFNYKVTPQLRKWFWYAVGVSAAIFLISLILFLFWRRKMHQKLQEKYLWATKSGITIQEADVLIEKGKELFIDGKFISVDFNKIIGKGSSAIVYEGFLATVSPVATLYPRLETRNFSNCKTAIKIGNTFSKDEFEQIFREVEAAIKLGWHRHICCLLGWSIHSSMPVLMFELIEGSDLLSWAQSFEVSDDGVTVIPEKTATQILWQISDGMEHISSIGILHKDLAARNILLSQRLEAKITDFGLASSCTESFTYEAAASQKRLPIRWMAPEALRNRIFSEFSDVWAFGILAWEVFNKGAVPYGTLDGSDILQYISDGNRLKIPDEISENWKKLLNDCWNESKEGRPSFKDIRIQIGSFLETQTINYGYLSCDFNDI